jgi:hypothetical protein
MTKLFLAVFVAGVIPALAQPVPSTTAYTRWLLASTNQAQFAERAALGTNGGGTAYNLNASTNLPWAGLADAARAEVTNAAVATLAGTASNALTAATANYATTATTATTAITAGYVTQNPLTNDLDAATATFDEVNTPVLLINGVGAANTNQLPYFNVRDYGAFADDATEDTYQIEAAMAAARANGGGTVFFHNGVYHIGNLSYSWWETTVPGHETMSGVFIRGTNLTLLGESKGGVVLISITNVGHTVNFYQATNCSMENIIVDGGTGGELIGGDSIGSITLRNVTARNSTLTGFGSGNAQPQPACDGFDFQYGKDLFFENCVAQSCSGAGFSWQCDNWTMLNCLSTNVGFFSGEVDNAAVAVTQSSYWTVDGLTAYSAVTNSYTNAMFAKNIFLTSGAYGQIVNCNLFLMGGTNNAQIINDTSLLGNGVSYLTIANNNLQGFYNQGVGIKIYGSTVDPLQPRVVDILNNRIVQPGTCIVWSATSGRISGNTIIGQSYETAIVLNASTNLTVTENTIRCYSDGIKIYSGNKNLVLSDNRFEPVLDTNALTGFSRAYVSGSVTNMLIKGNVFFGGYGSFTETGLASSNIYIGNTFYCNTDIGDIGSTFVNNTFVNGMRLYNNASVQNYFSGNTFGGYGVTNNGASAYQRFTNQVWFNNRSQTNSAPLFGPGSGSGFNTLYGQLAVSGERFSNIPTNAIDATFYAALTAVDSATNYVWSGSNYFSGSPLVVKTSIVANAVGSTFVLIGGQTDSESTYGAIGFAATGLQVGYMALYGDNTHTYFNGKTDISLRVNNADQMKLAAYRSQFLVNVAYATNAPIYTNQMDEGSVYTAAKATNNQTFVSAIQSYSTTQATKLIRCFTNTSGGTITITIPADWVCEKGSTLYLTNLGMMELTVYPSFQTNVVWHSLK